MYLLEYKLLNSVPYISYEIIKLKRQLWVVVEYFLYSPAVIGQKVNNYMHFCTKAIAFAHMLRPFYITYMKWCQTQIKGCIFTRFVI